jgi:hypothetical protein
MRIERHRMYIGASALLIFGAFAAANFHLVSVSLSSQPACVHKEGATPYSAAKPSC